MSKNAVASAAKRKRSTSFDPEVARAVGTVIRIVREAREFSQDGFALHAGVDRSYYGKLERGERQPTVGLLLRIAKALDVNGAELLAQAETLLEERPTRRRARN
ncbi:helix-turn-helix domain-containing protein [Roseateles sp. MS654]|uniref:helix-turn-helix domain-containing protein n=1 Tax=Roseateles sp. MS654 TaxID=3412685 RepID=UPI003C2B8294